MNSVDVINVAGLLIDGKEDGIESELNEKSHPRFLRTIAPTPLGSAIEHPKHAIERAVQMIQEIAREIENQGTRPNIMLIGRSYGAFIALLAAIRLQFHNISRTVLIEGPLHPDVSVTPPHLLPPLLACGAHYRARPELAREAARQLEELGTSRLLVVQGGRKDGVVPTEAQIIPGDFETLELTADNAVPCHALNGRGVIVKLPSHMGGRADGAKKLLPEDYRTHLFWSDEKMEAVRKIIESAAAG